MSPDLIFPASLSRGDNWQYGNVTKLFARNANQLRYLGPNLCGKLSMADRLANYKSLTVFNNTIRKLNVSTLLDDGCKDCALCNTCIPWVTIAARSQRLRCVLVHIVKTKLKCRCGEVLFSHYVDATWIICNNTVWWFQVSFHLIPYWQRGCRRKW